MRIGEGLLDILIAFVYVFLTFGVLIRFASQTAHWVKMDLAGREPEDTPFGAAQQPDSVASLEVRRSGPERE
ncbi:MAG: hypothetical protein EPN64_09960 [Burkholderiaceae bacterium]|nr:MAG: hypothetical protein EPN64_09960 [Burkholderiaceae bacterium]